MALSSRSSSSLRLHLCFKNSKDSQDEGSMRIIDVLSDRDGDGDGDGEIEGSKRKRGSLVSRLFSKHSFKLTKKEVEEEGLDSGEASGVVVDPNSSSGEAAGAEKLDSEPRSSEMFVADSGRKHVDFSFNLGMGVGLAFLLAKSTSEYNKMMELRMRMEMLLKEIRHEVQRRDAPASTSESNNNISFSPSHCCGDMNGSTSMPNRDACFSLKADKRGVESDRGSKYATAFANTRSTSMDQMEAELEVELERLDHNLEGEGSSSLWHRMEVDRESNDPSFESFNMNHEEDEAPEYENLEYNGVCPHQLERKLHELLETRQQEKIAELESALERAEQKLREKEMELYLWKENPWVASLEKEDLFISKELKELDSSD